MPKRDHHEATANVVQIVELLNSTEKLLSTREISQLTDTHRDTCRRALRELQEWGWVNRQQLDGVEVWTAGSRLPALAMQHQARIVRQMRALRREADLLTAEL